MGQRPFKKPVFLKLNSTGNYQARSAWEALEYLDLHWPADHNAHYRTAVRLCQEAIDGNTDAEVARRALIDAAQRAGVLEKGWMPLPDGARSVYRAVGQFQTQAA